MKKVNVPGKIIGGILIACLISGLAEAGSNTQVNCKGLPAKLKTIEIQISQLNSSIQSEIAKRLAASTQNTNYAGYASPGGLTIGGNTGKGKKGPLSWWGGVVAKDIPSGCKVVSSWHHRGWWYANVSCLNVINADKLLIKDATLQIAADKLQLAKYTQLQSTLSSNIASCKVKPAPTLVKPKPVKPKPVKPTPVKPTPVKPTPVKPKPVKPTSVKPASAKPTSAPAAPRGYRQRPEGFFFTH